MFTTLHVFIDKSSRIYGQDTCDKLIRSKLSRNKIVNNHEMCPNGCYLYDIKDDVNTTVCPKCDLPRPTKEKTIQRYRRITEKLAQLIVNEETREELMYRHNNYSPTSQAVTIDENDKNKTYNDIFDGRLYKIQCEQGNFDNPLDIALKIDIDGFKSKYSNLHMTMIHVVILNFDLSNVSTIYKLYLFILLIHYLLLQRYTREHTFQVGIIHGKEKQDTPSFLRPILRELRAIHHKPILVKHNGVKVGVSRATVLVIGADGVEMNNLMCFYGHTGAFGCRFCLVCGKHRIDGSINEEGNVVEGKHGMYFQSRTDEIRSYPSLLLEDKTPKYVNTNAHNIFFLIYLHFFFFFRSVNLMASKQQHPLVN